MRALPTIFRQVGDLNEIIFAHRNKSYGAYELRKHYHERLLKAFIITVFSSLVAVVLISLALNRKPPYISGDLFPPAPDTIKTFTDKTFPPYQEPSRQNHMRQDQPPTVIVNDTMAEHKAKTDSAIVQGSVNNSLLNGDSASPGDNTGGKGIAMDTFSHAKNAEPEVRVISEVMPSFPGGNKAFSQYIRKHFDCSGENIAGEGKIVLRFVVMNDGSIARVEVLRENVGIDCVNEAKNLLLNSPKWNPGLQNNQPVNVMMVLPITIQKE